MRQDSTASALPSSLTVHVKSKVMEVGYEGGQTYRIPFELMRVYSPSAEVMGHGPGQETLQVGKMHVIIEALEPVGHYAVKPKFSDGHESGIFSWDYIAWLGGVPGQTHGGGRLTGARFRRDGQRRWRLWQAWVWVGRLWEPLKFGHEQRHHRFRFSRSPYWRKSPTGCTGI